MNAVLRSVRKSKDGGSVSNAGLFDLGIISLLLQEIPWSTAGSGAVLCKMPSTTEIQSESNRAEQRVQGECRYKIPMHQYPEVFQPCISKSEITAGAFMKTTGMKGGHSG